MSGNLPMVIWLIFFLVFSTLLFKAYDKMFEDKAKGLIRIGFDEYNETYEVDVNNTAELQPTQFGDFRDTINIFKYANVPWWITLLVYLPLSVGIIYLLIPTFK